MTDLKRLAERIAHLETGSQSYEEYITQIESLLSEAISYQRMLVDWDARIDQERNAAYIRAATVADEYCKHSDIYDEYREGGYAVAREIRAAIENLKKEPK